MNNIGKYNISAFFPVYNDWGTIGSMVLLLDSKLKKIAKDYEIILVDDGSDKITKEIIQYLSKKFEKVKIITHKKNMGYGAALKTGIYNSKYELIFYTDSDAQYNPSEIENLLEKFNDKIDIVNGYKISRQDPIYRKIIGNIYLFVTKIFFRFKIKDVDCDFRLIRKSVLDNIVLIHDSGVICVEMITKLTLRGAIFEEFPVNHYYRTSGKSQFFNFKRIFKVFIDLFKLWYQIFIKKKY